MNQTPSTHRPPTQPRRKRFPIQRLRITKLAKLLEQSYTYKKPDANMFEVLDLHG
jgi:hypothetical protein